VGDDVKSVYGSLLSVAIGVTSGCLDPIGRPACVDSGTTVLGIPESRLPHVASIQTDGVCTAEASPRACDGEARCYQDSNGQTFAAVEIRADRRGTCSVVVEYNDGCAVEEVQFEFGGPQGNCCEDVCAIHRRMDPVSSACGGQ
jgi:hypothetical protein